MPFEDKQFSHYRILQLIGKGGMGEVYLLEDLRIQRQVAAKFIRMEEMQSHQEVVNTALRLFWREATAIARLDHPSILPLYDHGEAVINGIAVAYFVMPYRSEGSLMSWLRKRAHDNQTQQLTLKQIIHLIRQASESLQYAHDHQVMHLDVKPANFLIQSRTANDDYPDLLLSDFGIARLATMTSHLSQNVRGTPAYMSPEQCNGQPTFASDQYALAIMAYELLVGHPPFRGNPLSVMFAHVHERPPSVSQQNALVPLAVDTVLQRGLAKKPAERFPSITHFARAFEQAFQGMADTSSLRVLNSSPAMPSKERDIPQIAGDIHATLAISTEEARNGTQRTLTLANGRIISVQIPPGAQSDQVLILIGQGEIPRAGAVPGNLYLTLSVISVPTHSSVEEDEIDSQHPESQLTQALLSPSPDASKEENIPFTPTLTNNRDRPSQERSLAQQAITLPPSDEAGPTSSPQRVLVAQQAITLPPARPKRSKRSIPRIQRILLLMLALVLIAGLSIGITGAYTGRWLWNMSQWPWIGQTLNSVTWSGSQFVAVGDAGIILTSPDGHTWNTQNAHISSSLSLHGITWSGSQFVAVGNYGTVLTSPDGHTWNTENAHTYEYMEDVIWSGSQFVAVGNAGTILTSSDGRTWISRNSGTTQDLLGITRSGSQFMAVGDAGTILTSPDGHTWTAHNVNANLNLSDVVWSGSLFAAVEGFSILTSPDGSTWTTHDVDASQGLNSIIWSDSRFVALGSNGTILTSLDGNTWTSRSAGVSASFFGIARSSSQFLAVGNNIILTSPDGYTWSTA